MFLKDLVNLLGAELCEYKVLFYSWTSKTFRTFFFILKKASVIEGKVEHLQSQDFDVIRGRKEIVKFRIFHEKSETEGSNETKWVKKIKTCCSVTHVRVQVISIYVIFKWIPFLQTAVSGHKTQGQSSLIVSLS